MEWIGIVLVAIVAFFIGHSSRQTKTMSSMPTQSGLNSASDRDLMLATFRRELANYLVWTDPDRFVRLYRKAHEAEAAIEAADKNVREAEFTLITKRFAMYGDFDLIATRSYVLYTDTLNRHELDEIEEHYLDLVRFHALQRADNPDWELRPPATSEDEFEHLQSYVQKIKDTKFRQRLVNAVREFFAQIRDPFAQSEGQAVYETRTLAVYRVPHIVEVQYGFHFKDTDEFGIYSSFYDGDRDKSHRSLYRSDRSFKTCNGLNFPLIDEAI
jgi:hypothetical protein